MNSVLREADYVLVNCALTPETRGLIGAREIGQMKKDAVIVNTARGPIIQQQALIDALENGRLGGAALDVFEKEPLEADSRLIGMATSFSPRIRSLGRRNCFAIWDAWIAKERWR